MQAPIDHRAFLAGLPAEERRHLCAQADGPGVLRLAIHLGLVLGIGALIASGIPLWWLLMVPQGILIVFLFTTLHETIHGTAFRTPWLNTAVAMLCGLLVLLPPRHFRYFHMAHHRFTHDPENDPELAAPKPQTLWQYLSFLSGIPDWTWRVRNLFRNAVRPNRDAYVPPRGKARVRGEARAFIAVYAIIAAISLTTGTWTAVFCWLLPMLIGAPALRGYLLAEHARCPHVADMFQNTRTTLTNRVVRWIAWNMPYHAEHHAYPAVPFHRLPDLHRRVRAHLSAVEPGYATFNARYAADAMAGKLAQDG